MIPGSSSAQFFGAAGAAGGAGYEISRSLRFSSIDSAYLSHSVTSSSNQKCTISFWLKRTTLGGTHYICTTHPYDDHMLWLSGDTLRSTFVATGSPTWSGTSAPVFRDPSAWYHVVIAFDTTQAVAADRVRLYVNGSSVSWSSYIGPVLNTTFRWNSTQFIGRYGSAYGDFYLAEFYTIDGQQLTADEFGGFDSNGVWQPKEYTGTFGTGGSYLPFSDNSTAAALGTDTSGNGNTWSVFNLSVAAGAGNDSLVDTPTSYGTDTGAGGEVRGNYATFNPLRGDGFIGGLTNGNLEVRAASTGQDYRPLSTIGVSSGKWYWEVTKTYAGSSSTDFIVGIANATDSGSTYSSGSQRLDPIDTIYGVSLDFDTLTFAIKKNNVALYSTSIVANTYFAYVNVFYFGAAASATVNFGQRPFAYTAPSGFQALCTTNLPAPVVAQPSTVMDVKLYTGTGTSQTISGLGFSPDFIWTKARSTANSHFLYDVLRVNSGSTPANKPYYLRSDSTAGESVSAGITSFDSNGFTLDGNSSTSTLNATYVAWTWDAGSSTVTNTQGSITSQVRANASAGFSIVTYTGTGASATVGHGLGVTPRMIIVKRRDATSAWPVYHRSVGGIEEGFNWRIELNTDAAGVVDYLSWNGISPTSTVFSIGASSANTNVNGGTYVAYCFAPVAGYSSFGSYTGNGSADGPAVFTSMRPRFLLIKRTDTTGNWLMYDSARDSFNSVKQQLYPNSSSAENPGNDLDFLSNGFKLRTTNTALNASGGTYVYASFAEFPFAYARAR